MSELAGKKVSRCLA